MSTQIDLYAAARDLVLQPPPPSLREILSAYRAKGDGDRDMLLAMLNAKTAEEQCLSNRTALCRTLVDTQHYSYSPSMNDRYYPTPSASVHSPPETHSLPPSRRDSHRRHSRSPPRSHSPYTLAPLSESRKRHRRASPSPLRQTQTPHSPVSSASSITDSPRSVRPSMAIGTLLSKGSQAEHINKLGEVSDERFKGRDYSMAS